MNNLERSRDILKNVGFDLLEEGKTIRIRAHGYSMYPCIKPGTIILIEPLKNKGLPVQGEIVAIKRNSGLVVHRVQKIIKRDNSDLYIARGDSNAWSDEPVKLNRIAGRIVGSDGNMADLSLRKRPSYIINRLRVLWIILKKKLYK